MDFRYEIFISHMELKQFTYEILFLYVKLYVKVLKGLAFASSHFSFCSGCPTYRALGVVKHYSK